MSSTVTLPSELETDVPADDEGVEVEGAAPNNRGVGVEEVEAAGAPKESGAGVVAGACPRERFDKIG